MFRKIERFGNYKNRYNKVITYNNLIYNITFLYSVNITLAYQKPLYQKNDKIIRVSNSYETKILLRDNRRSYFLDNFLNTDDISWKIGQNEALRIL